jgi:putative oxidoreductase
MHVVQGFLSLVARLMITAIFLSSAVMNKIPQFNGVAEMMAGKDIPQPKILLAGAIAFLLLGSVSLILGFKARWGAMLLLVFLAAATYYFHAFWKLPADTAPETFRDEQIAFMKNLALMGTMVFFLANGSGPWSLDRLRSKAAEQPADEDET